MAQDKSTAFQYALVAIEYRPEAKAAFDSIHSLPKTFRRRFLQLLDANPQGPVDQYLGAVREQYERWLNPYGSKKINLVLQEARELGPRAEREFRKVMDILGESADPVAVLKKVHKEIGPAPGETSTPLDRLCHKYGCSSLELMKKLGITLTHGGYFFRNARYDTFEEAAVEADKECIDIFDSESISYLSNNEDQRPASQAEVVKARPKDSLSFSQGVRKKYEVLGQDSERASPVPVGRSEVASKRPQGVGGWLIILVLGMMVVGPFLGAAGINGEIFMAENQYPEIVSLEEWGRYKALTWACFIGFVAISFWGGWGLARGKTWGVVERAKTILWVTGPGASIILGVVVPLAAFDGTDGLDGEIFGSLIGSILAATIWTLYLSRSKRVRNTYRKADS